MKKGPVTPKGFRDINPSLAKKRREAINKIADVLEKFGFEPLETPTIEFAETLLGKYGEDEKLIYQFTDRGGRKIALRYDLTVPLARYVANNNPALPFRRYQIGQVFRGENPQAGRYREFTQFDFDTVGGGGLFEDANVIIAAIKAIRTAGLNDAKMMINDRSEFRGLKIGIVRAIDKLYKIGKEGVIDEIVNNKLMSKEDAIKYVGSFDKRIPPPNAQGLFQILEQKGLKRGKDFEFDPTLARGLDYYTSTIFELKPNGKPEEQTIGGGGRYDNLIGMFAGHQIPAVGFSFGIDRITELI